jgi:large subunit ribosomal protein L11
MAKQVIEMFRMQVPGGQATPGPPVGVALGPRGVNPGAFCKDFNDQTREFQGMPVTVEMTVYKDKSFSFRVLSPPAAVLLKKAASIVKGANAPNKETVGEITRAQLEDVAKQKMKDLNTQDLAQAVRQMEGSARSMGLKIVD